MKNLMRFQVINYCIIDFLLLSRKQVVLWKNILQVVQIIVYCILRYSFNKSEIYKHMFVECERLGIILVFWIHTTPISVMFDLCMISIIIPDIQRIFFLIMKYNIKCSPYSTWFISVDTINTSIDVSVIIQTTSKKYI